LKNWQRACGYLILILILWLWSYIKTSSLSFWQAQLWTFRTSLDI
jgi:hypothetical protein